MKYLLTSSNNQTNRIHEFLSSKIINHTIRPKNETLSKINENLISKCCRSKFKSNKQKDHSSAKLDPPREEHWTQLPLLFDRRSLKRSSNILPDTSVITLSNRAIWAAGKSLINVTGRNPVSLRFIEAMTVPRDDAIVLALKTSKHQLVPRDWQ